MRRLVPPLLLVLSLTGIPSGLAAGPRPRSAHVFDANASSIAQLAYLEYRARPQNLDLLGALVGWDSDPPESVDALNLEALRDPPLAQRQAVPRCRAPPA